MSNSLKDAMEASSPIELNFPESHSEMVVNRKITKQQGEGSRVVQKENLVCDPVLESA